MPYTIEDVKGMTSNTITPEVASDMLDSTPQKLRTTAKTKAGQETLGFPVSLIGTRLKIPRAAFVAWFEGQAGCRNQVNITKKRFDDLVTDSMLFVSKEIYGCKMPFERPHDVRIMSDFANVLAGFIFGGDSGEN